MRIFSTGVILFSMVTHSHLFGDGCILEDRIKHSECGALI